VTVEQGGLGEAARNLLVGFFSPRLNSKWDPYPYFFLPINFAPNNRARFCDGTLPGLPVFRGWGSCAVAAQFASRASLPRPRLLPPLLQRALHFAHPIFCNLLSPTA